VSAPPHRRPSAKALAPACAPATIAAHAALLTAARPVLWLGFGARHAAGPIRRLVERLGARVMCSPRGKGVFPEDHPRFLGVTGVGGHTRVDELLAAERPAYTLVLGTRLGESTSFWASELTPAEAFIHVDADPAALGAPTRTCRPTRRSPRSAPTSTRSWPRWASRPPRRPRRPRRAAVRCQPPRRRRRAPAVPVRGAAAGDRRRLGRVADGRERQLVLLVDPPPALPRARPLPGVDRLRLDGPRHHRRRRRGAGARRQGGRGGRRRRDDDDERAAQRGAVPGRRAVGDPQRRLLPDVRPGHDRDGLGAVLVRSAAGRLRRAGPGDRRRRRAGRDRARAGAGPRARDGGPRAVGPRRRDRRRARLPPSGARNKSLMQQGYKS
jgi:hypothetical protein